MFQVSRGMRWQFSIENCSFFRCTRNNRKYRTNQSWRDLYSMLFHEWHITQFTFISMCVSVPIVWAEYWVPRFFCLARSFSLLGVMKLCQMTKTYLLVHNVIGEVMWHVTYYLSLSSSLIASAQTLSAAAVHKLDKLVWFQPNVVTFTSVSSTGAN